jgi:hypothetical protein
MVWIENSHYHCYAYICPDLTDITIESLIAPVRPQSEENEWNDKVSLQMMVKDVRVSE